MREKLIELLEIVTQEYAEEIADYLIENGTVIPVRCGECKLAREPYKGGLYCQGKREVTPDHYCSYGKPKEDEE